MKLTNITLAAIVLPGTAMAGPLAYAACQAACSTTLAAGPAGVALYAACQSACAPLLVMPCP
ncbi:uncharacterized protein TrAtP1_001332 [Trichoderma atroviride]|uniref:uncharacterized protein n=1 Tax=Hypocrea atroviridis TaxID=63577 RepID=UPI0033249BF8|nr:hypothetical protein TrAtP1_001332 [Trichoderma atroviride]